MTRLFESLEQTGVAVAVLASIFGMLALTVELAARALGVTP